MKSGRQRLKIACPSCGQRLDLTGFPPFAHIQCPSCSGEIIVPQPFGELMLEEPLSERGPVTVYRALDLTLDREVAVKALRAAGEDSSALCSAFLRQARRSAAVNHPHIVPIYSCGENEGAPYLVMQYMAGGTLAEKIRAGGTVDLPWATGVVIAVAAGLQAAHKRGLRHGGVRPSNILFDADAHVKIADFGLSLPALSGAPRATERLGRPDSYTSPETRGKLPTDVRADIYGLGATFYHLATGRPAGSALEEETGRMVPPHALNSRVPYPLSDCIMRMLDPVPEKRPGDYTAVIDALKGLSKTAPGPEDASGRRVAVRLPVPSGDTRKHPLASNTTTAVAPRTDSRRTTSHPPPADVRRTRWRWLNTALAVSLIVLLVLLAVMLLRHRAPPSGTGNTPASEHRGPTRTGLPPR